MQPFHIYAHVSAHSAISTYIMVAVSRMVAAAARSPAQERLHRSDITGREPLLAVGAGGNSATGGNVVAGGVPAAVRALVAVTWRVIVRGWRQRKGLDVRVQPCCQGALRALE